MKKLVKSLVILLILSISILTALTIKATNKLNSEKLPENETDLGFNEEIIDKEENDPNNSFDKDVINILLLGIDSRVNSYDGKQDTLSDTIIILSIDKVNNTIKLSSIMRDSYLYNPKREYYDKINHSYLFGQELEIVNSINTSLDMNIDKYITVNFDAVMHLINVIGGVEISIEPNEVRWINMYIEDMNSRSDNKSKYINNSGIHKLNGLQAVAYSRIRYTEGGDAKRTERQREVLEQVFEKVKGESYFTMLKMVNELLPYVKTSLSYTEIVSLARIYLSLDDAKLEKYMFPSNASGKLINEVYQHVPITLESNVINLHKFIYGIDEYEVSSKVKQLSDEIIKITGYR